MNAKHVAATREDGLFVCTVCGGAEGSLPSACPGFRMPPRIEEAVFNGDIDYIDTVGWVVKPYRAVPRAEG